MLEYWYLFPIAVAISTTAMTFGIGGASMFSPFFILALKLPVTLSVGLGLFIEIFSFSSGVIGFAKKKLINYHRAKYALLTSVPAAILGVLLMKYFSDQIVIICLAGLLLILAILINVPDTPRLPKSARQKDTSNAQTIYTKLFPAITHTLHGLGGFFAGLTGSGLGEINDYVYLKYYKLTGAVAAGTSIFVVAITALIASAVHATHLQPEIFTQLGRMLVWIIPGVIIGAQIGVRFSEHVPDAQRAQLTSMLFIIIAAALLLPFF